MREEITVSSSLLFYSIVYSILMIVTSCILEEKIINSHPFFHVILSSPPPLFVFISLLFFSLFVLDVKLNNQEHSVTVEAGQDNPMGQELKVIDQSILGKGVTVEKTKPNPQR